MPQHIAQTFESRRALLRSLVPRYQQASPAQKTLLLDTFVEWTGYTRKHAIRLLNHGEYDQQAIQRYRLPLYYQEVQQALFLAWKAAHYVCAKRLLPSLPTLVALLERHRHLHLTEEERRQLLAMSVSTAERYLRTQRKPCLHGLSTTTPGLLYKSQIPVCLFAPWEEARPGFVEVDLVAHCGDHLDGRFLYTMTLTDLATGWTECIPLLEKSADAVQAALSQARTLFPFPLLGIDTDSGSEFLNEQVITYCEQEYLTFTRGRPGVKNDQAHVEQKNRAVVREAVGCVRLGVRAYQQLGEVYRALRLVVNGFQPSFKLQAKVLQGERVRRVYDAAQTPLQRVLDSGVLSEERQQNLSKWVQQIDPLALSEYLDALRYALLCEAHLPPTMGAFGSPWTPLRFSLTACTSGPLPKKREQTRSHEVSSGHEEILELLQAHPEWTSTQIVQEIENLHPACAASTRLETCTAGLGLMCSPGYSNREDPWPSERLQGGQAEPLPAEPSSSEEVASDADQCATQDPSLPTPAFVTPGRIVGEREDGDGLPMTIEQAIAAYLQEMCVFRSPKTLEWHRTSLRALRRSVWRRYQFTDVRHLSRDCFQNWVADLHLVPSARTGAARTVSTVAAYARSARAFCNWLVLQGYVPESFFPYDAIPDTLQRPLHLMEPEIFTRLLQACQLQGAPGGHHAALTARNHAILWLLWETGMQVSELCCLRLVDVDRTSGTVSVQGKRGRLRVFSLSADGLRALCAYLDQARLTPNWMPAMPEAQDRLLLTERRRPLIKSNLTGLFLRLCRRAGFSETPICPSMLRDTYAVRFLLAGGDLPALQEQLGVAHPASVRRYQRFCDEQWRAEAGTQAFPEGQTKLPRLARRSKRKCRKARRRE